MPNEDGQLTPAEVADLQHASNQLAEAAIAIIAAKRAFVRASLPQAARALDNFDLGGVIATVGLLTDSLLGEDAPDHSEQAKRLLDIAPDLDPGLAVPEEMSEVVAEGDDQA